ncbi:MAG: acetyl-CoA carboxylase carboxyl transferase subunit alpha, partial [Oscillospiraceae bacterium]|nr:acetyl-CoA carboxylase carboxyl transferase subunit alpha [Oscillospiraceae bacterium]
VPIITVITGEGASGGALGIAQANKVLMLENATYSVISAKGFASILWKDPKREKEAIIRQKMTADDLLSLGIIDGVVPEPPEGAHKDIVLAAAAIKAAIEANLALLMKLSPAEIYEQRYKKFREIGFYSEIS